MNLSNKKILVSDFGLFISIASRLARDFGSVLYYCPWEEAFPGVDKKVIGLDYDGITRVDNIGDHVDSVDAILFPDCNQASQVEYYREHGYNVAGVGRGEEIELDKIRTRKLQMELGLPTQKTYFPYGITELKEALEEYKDMFVKINIIRGTEETFKNIDYISSLPILNKLQYDLGPIGEDTEFMIEECIEGSEPGMDGILWDGEVMSPSMYGFEVRGAGYIGKAIDYSKMPKQISLINEKFAPTMIGYGYRFFYSTELIVDKSGKGYLIDPCCRFAAPTVSALQTEMISNFSEVIWGMATGERIEPIMKAKYGGGLAIYSDWSSHNWLNVMFPPELRQWIKFRWAMESGDRTWVVPGSQTLGTVVALGNSPEEVFDTIIERVCKVKGYQINGGKEDMQKVMDAIKNGERYGIKF